jgi:hypothetical protein
MNIATVTKRFLLLSLLLTTSGVAQVSYNNWDFSIKAINSQMTDSLASCGVRSDATSDFDNAYDIPRPPRSPSGTYLEVYFPHSGGNYPPILGTRYARDYQGPVDPTWNMSVEASTVGPVTLIWDSSYINSIESRVQLFLLDITSGSLTNMRTVGRYSFTYSVKRDFQIIGAATLDVRYLMEGFWNGITQVQDTVTAYLAQNTPPFTFMDSSRVFLSALGHGLFVFPHVPSAAYYLVLTHRNHLDVWSPSALSLTKGTTSMSSYDFTTGSGQAYGVNALKLDGGAYVAWAGDVNRDGVIDFLDRNLTWNNRSQTGYLSTDCNGDNLTDSNDFTIVVNNKLKVRQHP